VTEPQCTDDDDYHTPTMTGIYLWGMAVFLAHYWANFSDPWA
jgi:hypothetical protein